MPVRVLVVDDDEAVLNTLTRIVSLAGHDAIGVRTFADAKRAITETPPGALVTDIRLGAFNGLQLAHQFRLAQPTSIVIVLSAWDDVTLRTEAQRVGARYLLKPIAAQELLDALRG